MDSASLLKKSYSLNVSGFFLKMVGLSVLHRQRAFPFGETIWMLLRYSKIQVINQPIPNSKKWMY